MGKYPCYKAESKIRINLLLNCSFQLLKKDWEILDFGYHYYNFERPVRKDDFRASGSGNLNYIYGSKVNCPKKIFDFAKSIFDLLNTSHLSIDIAYTNNQFYLLEFQAVYFGTVGFIKSDKYFYMAQNSGWLSKNKSNALEEEYVYSIINYIKREQ